MFFKDVAYKMTENITLDKLKRPKVSYTESPFFCNVKSIGQSEFYQASSVGLKPEIKLEAKLLNLDNVTHIKFKNSVYKILRTYKKEDITELTLTSLIIDNSNE